MSDTLCNEKKKPYTFSEDGNSCIITETRTPRYWYNYLWNENHYCAQISQTGHGRSYYLSEKADMCMMNQDDARYIYLRDEKSKECWNIGEGPLNTEVENYQCVHSIGSSRIQSSYQNIANLSFQESRQLSSRLHTSGHRNPARKPGFSGLSLPIHRKL